MSVRKRIHIVLDSIINFKGDAIVNAANENLLNGSGVCGVIFRAAGLSKLQAECDMLSPINTGEAVITKSYNLYPRIKAIIHTPGPKYMTPNRQKLLYNSYFNSLKVLVENGYSSIAFPSISTGIFGYPYEEASEIALKAITDFLKNDENVDVTLCFVDDDYEIYKYYLSLFDKLEGQND